MQDSLPPTPPSPVVAKPAAPAGHHLENCDGKSCGHCEACLRGGMPYKQEWLSFVVLFLLGVVTVLSVLLISEKRSSLMAGVPATEPQPAASAMKKYQAPAAKTISDYVVLPRPIFKGKSRLEASL